MFALYRKNGMCVSFILTILLVLMISCSAIENGANVLAEGFLFSVAGQPFHSICALQDLNTSHSSLDHWRDLAHFAEYVQTSWGCQ
jgi:hypothetical protein